MILKNMFVKAHKSLRSLDITDKSCYNNSIDEKEIHPLIKPRASLFISIPIMKLLSLKQVAARYGCSTRTITRKVSAEVMPKPIVLWHRSDGTSAANRWREQDLVKFDGGLR